MIKVKLMEKEYFNGDKERSTMENGRMVWKKAMVYGKALKGIHTLDNGRTAKLMVMECMFGRQETSMKVSGKLAWGTVTALISLVMVINISASITMGSLKVSDSTNGLMETATPDCLRRVLRKAKVNGARKLILERKSTILSKVSIKAIWKMAMENLPG